MKCISTSIWFWILFGFISVITKYSSSITKVITQAELYSQNIYIEKIHNKYSFYNTHFH